MTEAQKARAFDDLRASLGYIENGTSQGIVIMQDDATKDWSIRNIRGVRVLPGVNAPSLPAALDLFATAYGERIG